MIQIYDGCYTTKGCFGLSSSSPTKVGEREEMIAHQVFQSCVITRDCDMVVTYQKNSTGQFRFELGGIIKSDVEYVALGISEINKMPGASVMACSRCATINLVVCLSFMSSHLLGVTRAR